ncbi:conserved hypothetical protein [Rhodococcus jostii RHA1]|uniref:Uncharacterized protein n=1 Tax=Rhodococcus jostii (strain RHA1) TaxID=101510 RepID=Q0SBM6_RHOJR|nr:conserved hypothetical protein [Rhodococcus jostii RHA1]
MVTESIGLGKVRRVRYTGGAEVDRMFCLKDEDERAWEELPPLPEIGFGLAGSDPGMVYVYTGMYMGPLDLEVQVLGDRPVTVDDGWEDIEEVSFETFSDTVTVLTDSETPIAGFPPTVLSAGAGTYRVRVHSFGRDLMWDLVAEVPFEQYKIQIWPARLAGPVVVQHRSVHAVMGR